MANIIYLLKRIKKMDKSAMFKKINSIHQKTNKNKIAIFYDMTKCARKYGAGYMDYDLFEMYYLTPAQRDTYLTRGRNNQIDKLFNKKEFIDRLERKDNFNTNFNKFLKRDWLNSSNMTKDDFEEFIKKHHEFMIKPIDGSCGKGIEKVHIENFSSTDELFNSLKEKNAVIEELIKQNKMISEINPYAINTLRVVTILKDGQAHILCTYFRIGNGDKFVDNFNSGGMVAPVDKDTGIVIAPAIDKNKNLYEKHPVTGSNIKGFKFPFWEEMKEMVSEAARVIPEVGYVGWDVAFSDEGPLLVEGNDFPGHDIYQLPEHTPNKIGVYPEFKQYIS